MEAEDDATDAEARETTLAELAEQSRVGVEEVEGAEHGRFVLDTPAGRLGPYHRPDSVSKEGSDLTRTWILNDYEVSYSIDQTPGNETHTVCVSEA